MFHFIVAQIVIDASTCVSAGGGWDHFYETKMSPKIQKPRPKNRKSLAGPNRGDGIYVLHEKAGGFYHLRQTSIVSH